ncbi:hypothetical protein NARC_50105 [Candidatus Nitrosocosmicus arcticus]|uniref:Uncharacterized protein n=1 Tax=Candidatus Nitrosocosmicus arcticus TaxID=2035267 RepID=A0A557SWE8_9ARCH|nr:hypothetical protein NARC_50105 [Candidatus Nitrosocosmicus arcticus]
MSIGIDETTMIFWLFSIVYQISPNGIVIKVSLRSRLLS